MSVTFCACLFGSFPCSDFSFFSGLERFPGTAQSLSSGAPSHNSKGFSGSLFLTHSILSPALNATTGLRVTLGRSLPLWISVPQKHRLQNMNFDGTKSIPFLTVFTKNNWLWHSVSSLVCCVFPAFLHHLKSFL
jgi:hypothetical protein